MKYVCFATEKHACNVVNLFFMKSWRSWLICFVSWECVSSTSMERYLLQSKRNVGHFFFQRNAMIFGSFCFFSCQHIKRYWITVETLNILVSNICIIDVCLSWLKPVVEFSCLLWTTRDKFSSTACRSPARERRINIRCIDWTEGHYNCDVLICINRVVPVELRVHSVSRWLCI